MKLLIIGGGAIADCTHIPAAKKVLGIDNIILAEPNPSQIEKLKAKHGIVHFVQDYHDALSEADACVICTPPHLHNAILKDCIDAGLHVLCEKPLSPSSAETKVILANSKEGQVIGMCHTYRHFPNRLHVRKLIQDGFFGDSVSITIHEGGAFNWPTVSGYCFKKDFVPGGVLYDGGIHSMDFILWCLGRPDRTEYEDDAAGGLESNISLRMVYPKATAFFKMSRTRAVSNTLVVEGNGHKAVLGVYDSIPYEMDGVQYKAEDPDCDIKNMGVKQLTNFVNAINGKESLRCPVEDGVATIELLEQCYAQRKPFSYDKHPLGGFAGKRVLVIGGTGFIGSQLVEQLVLHEDAKVRVLVHSWGKAAYVSRFDVEFVQGDLLDETSMTQAMEGCDYVFHLAIPGGKGHDEFVANNVKAVETIMAAAKHCGVKHVVQTSSVVVHGETVPADLTADSPLVSYGDSYADGKLEAEKRFWELRKQYGLHGSIIRPTYVWGPYSMWYTIYITEQMSKGEFCWVENGSGQCNAVYVGNVVDLCLQCCTNPKADGQAFIATDDEKITWREFYGHYMNALGLNPEQFQSIPLIDGVGRKIRKALKTFLQKHMDSLWNKYEKAATTSPTKAKWLYKAPRKILRLCKKQVVKKLPEMPATNMAIYSQFSMIDVKKNQELLGFKPRYSVKEGMKITCEWLQWSDLNDKKSK